MISSAGSRAFRLSTKTDATIKAAVNKDDIQERSMEKIFLEFAKNKREILRIAVTDFKDHRQVSVRVWVPKDKSGLLIPTHHGINFRFPHLDPIIETLIRIRSEFFGGVDFEKAKECCRVSRQLDDAS
jgi:hypothetical protein